MFGDQVADMAKNMRLNGGFTGAELDSLSDTEPMLFIGDSQQQIVKAHAFFNQGVGARKRRIWPSARSDNSCRRSLAEVEPVSKAISSPLADNKRFRVSKCCRARIAVGAIRDSLPTGQSAPKHGQGRDYRFSGTDIALNETFIG